MKNKRILTIACVCLAAMALQAKVTLPAFFSDGMVMQQQTKANLWGKASANKTVKVTTSWNGTTYSTQANAKGEWQLSVQTPEAGGPYEISFDDGERMQIKDILMGELWLCSGQSNMEMPMKGFKNQPVDHANMDVLRSRNEQIRLFTVKRNSQFAPVDDVVGSWKHAEPKHVREFSATAYYFGRLLQEQLQVPVGLVVAAWGGSSCEAWMRPDWLKAFPAAKIPQAPEDIKSKNRTPTVLFNGMLHPLIGLTMKGVIWYQGEDNWNRASTYADMFTTMIQGWRKEWNQGDFPFYYCQIAPYDYGIITAPGEPVINSAYLREQQLKAETMIPHVGMAVLLDAGMEKGIHPSQKQVAGERLARLALVNDYGVEGVMAQSACYKKIEVNNDTVTVFFDRANMWVNCKDKFASDLFEVAGEDRVFHPAKAWIERSKIKVKSEAVRKPVAVRYGFKNYVMGDLFCEDLPVSSFRSDDWTE